MQASEPDPINGNRQPEQMKTGKNSLRLLVLLAPLVGCASSPVEDAAVRTSLCELVSRGRSADGEFVRVVVIFKTDGLENSILVDENCARMPAAPRFPSESREDKKSLTEFKKTLYGGRMDEVRSRTIELDVSGTFRWRPNSRPNSALEMEKIWRHRRLE